MQKPPKYTSVITSPIGKIGIIFKQEQLSRLDTLASSDPIELFQDPKCQPVIDELMQYFENPRHIFTLTLQLKGTPFQRRVWETLKEMPSGSVMTYGMLAKLLQTGPRAIGQACRTNPISIVIPCHRIVAANHMGGYAGTTEGKLMGIKEWLLRHEGFKLSAI